MSCTSVSDLSTVTFTPYTTQNSGMASAYSVSGKNFMCSNDPETFGATGVLWHHGISAAAGTQTHRVYFFHVNGTGSNYDFSITCQNNSGLSLTIGNMKAQTAGPQPGGYNAAGLCVAKSQLGLALDPVTPLTSTVPSGATRTIWQLPNLTSTSPFITGLIEFTVSSNLTMYYTINTVAAPSGSDPTVVTNLLPKDGLNNRGSYYYSAISATTNTVALPNGTMFWICNPGSPDYNLFTASNSYDSANASGDSGLYGVDYNSVNVPLHNPTGAPYVVKLYLLPLVTNSTYQGAVIPGGAGSAYGVPTMSAGTNTAVLVDSVVISPYSDKTYVFSLAHGGESTLPVGLYVTT